MTAPTTIQLTEEQAKQVEIAFNTIHEIDDIIVNLIIKAAEKQVEEKMEAWKQLHLLAGTNPETHKLTFLRLTKTVEVTPL